MEDIFQPRKNRRVGNGEAGIVCVRKCLDEEGKKWQKSGRKWWRKWLEMFVSIKNETRDWTEGTRKAIFPEVLPRYIYT